MMNAVHERASNELACGQVSVHELGGHSFTAFGCAKTVTYTCEHIFYRTHHGFVTVGHNEVRCERNEPVRVTDTVPQ